MIHISRLSPSPRSVYSRTSPSLGCKSPTLTLTSLHTLPFPFCQDDLGSVYSRTSPFPWLQIPNPDSHFTTYTSLPFPFSQDDLGSVYSRTSPFPWLVGVTDGRSFRAHLCTMSTTDITLPKTLSYKLVLLGNSAVGKSSCANRFVKDEFLAFQQPTIGAAFMTSTVRMGDVCIKFEIWGNVVIDTCTNELDTAGQERYRSLAPMYYRGAACALVVFDLTDRSSFDGAKSWIDELFTQGSPDIVVAIAGNKSDMKEQRTVSTEEAEEFAAENGCIYLDTSAKTGYNITRIFQEVAKRLPTLKSEEEDGEFVSFGQNVSNNGVFSCCN